MRYGLPYRGSKSRIADWLTDILPASDVLVDLFAGGCAVTHCAMLKRKWKRFIINDISDVTQLFVDAMNGKYKDEKRWISREDFFRLKDSDPYVRYVWSFGNNARTYMYSPEIEPWKKAYHYAVVLGDFSEFEKMGVYFVNHEVLGDRSALKKQIMQKYVELGKNYKQQSLQSLERLQSLESLKSGFDIERLQKDYRDVDIPKGATVYCDIPYRGTETYNRQKWDYDSFYEWAQSLDYPIYISEYAMPDGFTCIGQKTIAQNFDKKSAKKHVTEKVFTQTKFVDRVSNGLPLFPDFI